MQPPGAELKASEKGAWPGTPGGDPQQGKSGGRGMSKGLVAQLISEGSSTPNPHRPL